MPEVLLTPHYGEFAKLAGITAEEPQLTPLTVPFSFQAGMALSFS